MAKIDCTELKPGQYFEDGGELYQCISADRNKTAMRKMVVIVKMKNLRTGGVKEETYSGEKLEQIFIEKMSVEFSWNDDDFYYFYTESGEDKMVPAARLDWEKNFMTSGLKVSLQVYQDTEILGVILPDKVELEITEAEPAVKGNTATSATKNAVCETGLQIRVPLFIETGERVLVSTADGKYSSRA